MFFNPDMMINAMTRLIEIGQNLEGSLSNLDYKISQELMEEISDLTNFLEVQHNNLRENPELLKGVDKKTREILKVLDDQISEIYGKTEHLIKKAMLLNKQVLDIMINCVSNINNKEGYNELGKAGLKKQFGSTPSLVINDNF